MPRQVRASKTLLIAMTAVLGTALPCAADPYVGYCYPAGIQAGTTVRVVVGGQGLWGDLRGYVSGEGVTVVGVERVPSFTRAAGEGQRAWVEKWIRNLEDGVTAMPPLPKDEVLRQWPRNGWWESLPKLDALSLSIVKRELFSPREDPLQAAPAISEQLLVTVTAEKGAAPGRRTFVLFNNNAASAPHPFFVTAEPHAAEPLYEAPPRKGKPRLPKESPTFRVPVVLDGQILPGETDVFRLALTGGETLTCLLTGRELMPYLGDTVPGFFNPVLRLTDEAGKELAFADDYRYLPDPVLTCRIRKSGTYRLEVRDNLYRGRADFVYSVACFADGRDLPTVQERAFVCSPRPESRGERTETIPCQGAKVSFDFEVERPGEYAFELFARRIGSPLDGVLRLYGPMTGWFWKSGPLLATWDDVTNRLFVGSVPQAECDPRGTWKFAEPGDYRLVVEDRTGDGGDECGFVLDIAPARPDFEVYATKAAFVLQEWKGSQASFKVKVVRRNGFAGPVTVVGTDAFEVRKGTVPAEADEAEIVVAATQKGWFGMRRASFSAVAEDAEGRRLERRVVPAHEVEQAFAYVHLLPTEDFLFLKPTPPVADNGAPTWIEMPYDAFLPRRVIHPHADLSAFKTDYAVALDALAEAEVALAKAPRNADDAVLAAKFASSALRMRKRGRDAFAVEAKAASEAEAARAVLAGFGGFVSPSLDYAPGDARRVRTMARSLALPHDNDMLVYVPSRAGNPLNGPVGAAARRLRNEGWCFDFVTDKTLTNAPCGREYRSVFVPRLQQPMPEATRQLLASREKERKCAVVYETTLKKSLGKLLAKQCRRETFPKGLRFVRFGRTWGEGWYFVHNPGAAWISGEGRFNIRGKPKSAWLMDVRTGEVRPLEKTKDGRFSLSIEAGGSAWVRVTAR